jgi:hypothetical protein
VPRCFFLFFFFDNNPGVDADTRTALEPVVLTSHRDSDSDRGWGAELAKAFGSRGLPAAAGAPMHPGRAACRRVRGAWPHQLDDKQWHGPWSTDGRAELAVGSEGLPFRHELSRPRTAPHRTSRFAFPVSTAQTPSDQSYRKPVWKLSPIKPFGNTD